jgi:hypothetical protein
MKSIKTVAFAVLALLSLSLSSSVFARGTASRISGGLVYVEPRSSTEWENGYGIELQYQFWVVEEFGFGAKVGWENWELAGQSGRSGRKDFYFDGEISGDVDMIPFGLYALYRTPMTKDRRYMVTAEAGFEHITAEPNDDFTYQAVSKNGATESGSEDLDGDSGMVFKVALDAERVFRKGLSLFVGAGYTFNLSNPTIEAKTEVFNDRITSGEITTSNEYSLDGFFLRLGLRKFF